MKYKLLPRLMIFIMITILAGVSLEVAGIYIMVKNTKTSVDEVYKETQYNLIDNIYNREIEILRLLISDYANWDDMYKSISNYDYVWSAENASSYLLEESSYDLDAVFIEGSINEYYEYHGTSDVEMYIRDSAFYDVIKRTNITQVKPVLIKGELYLLAGSPITTSDKRKYNGYYIMARYIGDDYIHMQLNEYLNVEEYLGINEVHNHSDLEDHDEMEIDISYLIEDGSGNVLHEWIVYFDMTRYHRSYDKIFTHTAVITLIVGFSVFIAIFYSSRKFNLLVETTILKLDRVAQGDYSYQISETKNYELNQVIAHVNNMGIEIGKHINKLQENHFETLGLLITAIEEKDHYTRGHSERVKEISIILAKELGIIDLELIAEAALLHDIGKIGIHEDILTKTSKLSEAEFEIIKTHPEKGERILKSSTKLSSVSKIIRQHHERIDGKGYPDGLAGAEIEIEARIIAVADAFDAMTSKRPYREEMSFEKGLSILEDCSGTQFDERIVMAFKKKINTIRNS